MLLTVQRVDLQEQKRLKMLLRVQKMDRQEHLGIGGVGQDVK